MIEIREVLSRKEQKIFATFNYKMYKNVFQAIPDLILMSWIALIIRRIQHMTTVMLSSF